MPGFTFIVDARDATTEVARGAATALLRQVHAAYPSTNRFRHDMLVQEFSMTADSLNAAWDAAHSKVTALAARIPAAASGAPASQASSAAAPETELPRLLPPEAPPFSLSVYCADCCQSFGNSERR